MGMSLDEWRVQHGTVTLSDACREEALRYKGSESKRAELGSISFENSVMFVGFDAFADMDDYAWTLFAKLLDIPIPYLLRLSSRMRASNVEYWLGVNSDKEVCMVVKDMELVELRDGMEISKGDVLDMLLSEMPMGEVMSAFSQSNAVVWDVIDTSRSYESETGVFIPGMRVVVKDGLNAPDISPIFVCKETCSVFECADILPKINIKSLGYSDILHVISNRISDCSKIAGQIFNMYRKVESIDVPEPKRRVALYCKEHGVSDRVRSYAISTFDESGLSEATLGDIIALFGGLGHLNEVKQASARRLQKLCGHIVTHAAGESRCGVCDSLAVDW